jgi:hypothetical protein
MAGLDLACGRPGLRARAHRVLELRLLRLSLADFAGEILDIEFIQRPANH